MNLESKISAAVRILEREYPQGIDQPTLDYVIGEITREHRAEVRVRLQAAIRRGLRGGLTTLRQRLSRLVWPQTRRAAGEVDRDHWVLP